VGAVAVENQMSNDIKLSFELTRFEAQFLLEAIDTWASFRSGSSYARYRGMNNDLAKEIRKFLGKTFELPLDSNPEHM
jgi:hypothetical protein